MQKYKKLQEVCDLLNVSRRVIQGYEEAKLVKPSGKNKYGHLLYDEDTVDLICRVRMFQQFGFEIKEIQGLLDAPQEIVIERLQQKVVILETKKQELDEVLNNANALLKKMKSGE